jgi:hypothetical protein
MQKFALLPVSQCASKHLDSPRLSSPNMLAKKAPYRANYGQHDVLRGPSEIGHRLLVASI